MKKLKIALYCEKTGIFTEIKLDEARRFSKRSILSKVIVATEKLPIKTANAVFASALKTISSLSDDDTIPRNRIVIKCPHVEFARISRP